MPFEVGDDLRIPRRVEPRITGTIPLRQESLDLPYQPGVEHCGHTLIDPAVEFRAGKIDDKYERAQRGHLGGGILMPPGERAPGKERDLEGTGYTLAAALLLERNCGGGVEPREPGAKGLEGLAVETSREAFAACRVEFRLVEEGV